MLRFSCELKYKKEDKIKILFAGDILLLFSGVALACKSQISLYVCVRHSINLLFNEQKKIPQPDNKNHQKSLNRAPWQRTLSQIDKFTLSYQNIYIFIPYSLKLRIFFISRAFDYRHRDQRRKMWLINTNHITRQAPHTLKLFSFWY